MDVNLQTLLEGASANSPPAPGVAKGAAKGVAQVTASGAQPAQPPGLFSALFSSSLAAVAGNPDMRGTPATTIAAASAAQGSEARAGDALAKPPIQRGQTGQTGQPMQPVVRPLSTVGDPLKLGVADLETPDGLQPPVKTVSPLPGRLAARSPESLPEKLPEMSREIGQTLPPDEESHGNSMPPASESSPVESPVEAPVQAESVELELEIVTVAPAATIEPRRVSAIGPSAIEPATNSSAGLDSAVIEKVVGLASVPVREPAPAQLERTASDVTARPVQPATAQNPREEQQLSSRPLMPIGLPPRLDADPQTPSEELRRGAVELAMGQPDVIRRPGLAVDQAMYGLRAVSPGPDSPLSIVTELTPPAILPIDLRAIVGQPRAARSVDDETLKSLVTRTTSTVASPQSSTSTSAATLTSQNIASLTSIPMEQLPDHVKMMAGRGLSDTNISVRIDKLGLVEIGIRMDSELTHVNFTVQNQGVRDSIEQHLPRLRLLLDEAGFSMGDVDVATSDHRQQQRSDGEFANLSQHPSTPDTPAERAGHQADGDATTANEFNSTRERRIIDAFA